MIIISFAKNRQCRSRALPKMQLSRGPHCCTRRISLLPIAHCSNSSWCSHCAKFIWQDKSTGVINAPNLRCILANAICTQIVIYEIARLQHKKSIFVNNFYFLAPGRSYIFGVRIWFRVISTNSQILIKAIN